jgi:hypothetical protein
MTETIRIKAEHKNPNFAQSLNRIETIVETITKTTVLRWFTKHDFEHSKRVLSYADKILKAAGGAELLNQEECYVLAASAYLHDIGMFSSQFLGSPSSKMGLKDYDLVRKKHPENTWRLLKAGEIEAQNSIYRFDMVVLGYQEIVGYICKGHGTDYFSEVVNTKSPKSSIRLPLITAILMIADELDLTEQRAVFNESVIHDKVSYLHNLKHCYISDVEILCNENTEYKPRIHLRCIPADSRRVKKEISDLISSHKPADNNFSRFDMSESTYYCDLGYKLAIWTSNKLLRQITMARKIFMDETKGKFTWADDPISFQIIDTMGDNTRRLLKGDNNNWFLSSYYLLNRYCEDTNVIDRKEFMNWVERFSNAQEFPEGLLVTIAFGKSEADLNILKNWTSARFREDEVITNSIEITSITDAPLNQLVLKPFGKNYLKGFKGNDLPEIKLIPDLYKKTIISGEYSGKTLSFLFYFDPASCPDCKIEDFSSFICDLNSSLNGIIGTRIFVIVFILDKTGDFQHNAKINNLFGDEDYISVLTFGDYTRNDIGNYFRNIYHYSDDKGIIGSRPEVENPEEFHDRLISLKKSVNLDPVIVGV